jgi:hypothetical protein
MELTKLANQLKPFIQRWIDAIFVPHMAMFTIRGISATETGGLRVYNQTGKTLKIVEVFASVSSAPVTTDVIVDVNNNGTSILTAALHIAVGANTGSTTGLASTSWADGDYFTLDVDQESAAGGGTDLVVQVVVR